MNNNYKFLNNINFPDDVRKLSQSDIKILADEVRQELIDVVSETGGHLGAGLGVVELTRQRVRPETEIKTTETCPTCLGKGEVQASILIIDEIDSMLNSIMVEGIAKSITLNVHPFIDAFLKKGVKNIQRQWFLKYKKWIAVRPMTELGILQYQFLDESDNSI